jgi:syntaxin 1B/2/3
MVELSKLSLNLSALVQEQELDVDKVDKHSDDIREDVKKGTKEIACAIESTRSRNRKKWWCLLVVILILVVIAVVVAVVVVVNKGKNKAAG